MKWHLDFSPARLAEPIQHSHNLMLVGSCFTENIGDRLARLKFAINQNPHGILYDPLSITNSIVSCIDKKQYKPEDLALVNGLWHSWDHHGNFSGDDQATVLNGVNASQAQAHAFLQKADWVFITLGSAFSYALTENGNSVANCHKAPAKSFVKRMLNIEEIKSSLDTCIHRLFHFNPTVKIIFTVSPVRYVRDGLVENNLSKARLIEVVQHLVHKFSGLYYFPAYELVIDVLRDYRFFKEDMVHPSKQAIDFVFEAFRAASFDEATVKLTDEIEKLNSALGHRPLFPDSDAHLKFKENLVLKMQELEKRHAYLDFSKEIASLKL